jgi:transcriptional regulator with XRE-family HTH domain
MSVAAMREKRAIRKSHRSNSDRRAKLRTLMSLHHLTAREVADLLDVHPITIAKWRAGTHPMPEASLKYLEVYAAEL